MWRRLTLFAFLAGCGPSVPELPPPMPPVVPTDAELLQRRPYVPILPASYSADAGTAWPLIVVLHGYAGDGAATLKYLHLDELAPQQCAALCRRPCDERCCY